MACEASKSNDPELRGGHFLNHPAHHVRRDRLNIMDPYHYHFIGMHFVWWLFWLALIVPFFLFTTPVRRKNMHLYRESPIEILQRRYAAGEITTEEYEERKLRIGRDTRVSKSQPLSPEPVEQDVPA